MSTPTVTLDALDVIELAELLAWIETWLSQADETVAADFNRWAWPYTILELRADLLARAVSLSGSPTDPS